MQASRKPLSPVISSVHYGSKPTDGGYLIVEKDMYDTVRSDPIASKYLRRYVGSRELVRNLDRWCLWLEGLHPTEIKQSSEIKSRLESVSKFRSSSKKRATRELASTPHLFAERRLPTTDFCCLPSVVSETRRYFTADYLPKTTVPSNLCFFVEDPDGLAFALASSSMLITWQKTVGGRLKSDIRFSNVLVWNTFPVPALDESTREEIISAGQSILKARALHPERSLADSYDPLAMEPSLIKAHDALDRAVDKAFGAPGKIATERERQETLFNSYNKYRI